MLVSVRTNTSAEEARRSLGTNLKSLSRAQAQLATGLNAPDPSDDPSASAIGYDILKTLSALTQASKNTSQATALIQLSVGTIAADIDIINRMYTLALQSNSDSVTDTQRSMLDKEYKALLAQVDTNSQTTWAGDPLFNGTNANTKSYTFQIGPAATDTITQNFNNLTQGGLAINGLSVNSKNNANAASLNLSNAINVLTNIIADFGGSKSRLEAASKTLEVSIQNQSSARSVFIDADISAVLIAMQQSSALVDTAAAMLQNTVQLFSRLAQLVVQGAR